MPETQSNNVQGVPKNVGEVVKRKVPAGFTIMSQSGDGDETEKSKKKKKKK